MSNQQEESRKRNRRIFYAIVLIAIAIYSAVSLYQHTSESRAREDAAEQERLHQARMSAYVKAHPLTTFFNSDFISGVVTLQEITTQKVVKDRLLVQYSQKFYDMLPPYKDGSTAYDYDTEQNRWYCEAGKGSNKTYLYYYPTTDQIEIVIYADDLYIGRDGEPELGEHNLKYPIDKSSKEYKAHVESLRAENIIIREEKEAHARYLYNLSLRPAFDSFDYFETRMPEVIMHSKVKERIVNQYSQDFYNAMFVCIDDPTVQFQGFRNEGHYYTYCSAQTESGSRIRLSYNSYNDELEVTLYIDSVEINKWGGYDIGSWTVGYFNNEFGEEDRRYPYVIIKLTVDKVNRPYYDEEDELIVRISDNDGVAIMYHRDADSALGDYVDNNFKTPTLIIRRDSDGEVFEFDLKVSREKSFISSISRSQQSQLFELLEGGGLTISYKYEYGLTDYSALIKVNIKTKKVYSAIALLFSNHLGIKE